MEILCEICESEAATIRVTAANAQGEILDVVRVCKSCVRQVDLIVGEPTESISE